MFNNHTTLLECNEMISTLAYTEISASSHKMWKRRKSCTPEMGHVESAKGWCPRRQSSEIIFFFLKMGQPRPLFVYFRSFQTQI